MKVSLGSVIHEIKKRSVQRRRFISILTVLSLLISSGVVWQLRSVGITLANDVCCGIEEHEHAESCFESELVCGIDETTETSDSDETAHVHTDECYEERLICDIPEHIHTVECCDNELAVPVQKQPEEVPVVELDSAVAGDVVESEENIESEDDEVTEDVQDADTSDEEQGSDYAVNLFPNAVMNSFMSVYALSANEVSVNIIYLKTDSGVENVPLDSEGYFVMNTGEVSSFYIKTNSSNSNNFYMSDRWSGVASVKNTITDSGYHEAKVTASNSGFIKLCFDTSSVSGTYQIVELKIKVINIELKDKNAVSIYNENNPYTMAVGQSFEVHAYDPGTADYYFYCSFDVDKSQTVTMNYNNKLDTSYTSGRKVVGTFTAVEPGTSMVNFCGKSFYVNVKPNEEEKDKIYVVTALGEREKDKINEYLAGGSYPDSNVPQTDDGYIRNTAVYPYIMYVGEQIKLCTYINNNNKNFWMQDYDGNKVKITNVHNGSRNEVTVEANVAGDYIISHETTASTGSDNISFYLRVLESDSSLRDHADIEITDGGYYEFRKEEVITADGKRIVTIERYDSFITGVNHCYLYGKDNSVVGEFFSSDYQASGEVGGTQYELTSKWSKRTDKKFDRSKVYSAKYDVSLTLKPSTRTVTTFENNADTTGTSVVTNISGGEPINISSAIFELGLQSVIDAHNKCPDHSGLDFNVSACLNQIVTNVKFTATKKFEDITGSDTVSPNRTYTFELVDKDNKVVDTVQNDASGYIEFNNIFLSNGEYDYTIREKIPDDALNVDGKKYQQGSPSEPKGVFYDQNTVTYRVHVTSNNGIVSSTYSKKVGESIIAIDNFTDAFTNIVVDEKYTDLNVVKEWSDGNDKHNDQQIKFRIYRVEGSNRELVSIGGETEFYNGSNDSWKKTYSGLPVEMAGHSYSYEVEETDIPDGYIVSYSSDTETNTCKIINTLKTQVSISIKKVWTSQDGNSISNPPVDSISAVLKRNCKEAKIPVKISIVDSSGIIINTFVQPAYAGSGFDFTISPDGNNLVTVKQATLCDCTKNSTAFTVNNISAGAEIELLYSDEIFVHHTFEETSENWNKRGDSAALGEAWSTCYATDSQNHMHALKISNRTYEWNGAQFALDINKFVPGHIYSFSAYVLYKTDSSLNPSNVNFKLTLQYNNGSGGENYNTIASADNALSNNWYHLSNANFTIPAGATNMFLVIETVETYNDSSNSGKYVDIYLDEVIIASEGAGIEVDKESGDIRMTNNVKIVSENIPTDIQNSANNWFLDNSWSKTITLEKSKGWTITETNLDELSNRIYQYYVEEVSVPGFTTNYLCTNVSSNTPDSPIIIQNKAIQYTLPPTGGSGTEKYKTAGLILIFVASAAFIIKRKKFDIKKG